MSDDIVKRLRGIWRDPASIPRIELDAADEIERLRNQVERLKQTQRRLFDARVWHPMETAPSDGTWILTYRPMPEGNGVNQARLQTTIFGDCEWGGKGWSFPESSQPTHWMPLPEPPAEG